MKKTFFCSWSGGKDSCLSLYKTIQSNGKAAIKALVTMCIENGKRSRSHGLSIEFLHTQAQSIGIPLLTKNTSWPCYKKNCLKILKTLKDQQITTGIFGDIDIEEHRQWEEELCSSLNMQAELPLWKNKRKNIIREFLDLQFKAIIVSVKADKLSKKYLGKFLNKTLIKKFEKIGIDVCGENGEYHTAVIDGPIFRKKLDLKMGNIVFRDGYWFQNFTVLPLK